MCLQEILRSNYNHEQRTARFKRLAPTYPEIYFETGNDGRFEITWATTMIEFIYEGKKYARHHVQSLIAKENDKKYLRDILKEDAELLQKFGVPLQEGNFKYADGTPIEDDVR